MSIYAPVYTFTWQPVSHEIVKRRFGWPPFAWTLASNPERAVATYYDSDGILGRSGIQLRTHYTRTGQIHREALGITATGKQYVTTHFLTIHALLMRHLPTFNQAGLVSVFNLDKLCSTTATRTVFQAIETAGTFRVVLDVTNWGHRVGMVEFLGPVGIGEDAHQIIEAFMARYPTFFDKRNYESTLDAWRARMGVAVV